MSSKIFGIFRKFVAKCSGKIGKCRKVLKSIFRQCLKIFENARETSETLGKVSNAIESSREIFIKFQSDTRYGFCTAKWCYSLTALLSANQNRVTFSCMLLLLILVLLLLLLFLLLSLLL